MTDEKKNEAEAHEVEASATGVELHGIDAPADGVVREHHLDDAPPPPDAPPSPPPAEKKPIEQWGEAKGHIKPGYDPENRYVSSSNDPRHRAFAPQDFNCAKHLRGWPIGAEVTEAEYDAAILAAQNLTAQ